MKVVRIHEFGGPDVLTLEDVPMPEPTADEVLVRIHAASVNPVDYKMRTGGVAKGLPEGVHLGRDIAGTIEKPGDDVVDLAIGDHVYAMPPRDRAGYAEFVTVPAALCVRVPKNMDDMQAAAVPLAALTAWQGLFDHGGLKSGQHVLIHGGAGGVGHLAVQMAHATGAKVSTTVSGEDQDFALELGAEQVVDYKTERFEEKVRDVDLVLDLVDGETQERSWEVLRPGGALVSTLGEPSQEQARRSQARGVGYFTRPDAGELQQITNWIETGKIHPVLDSTLPLTDVAKAHEILEHGHVQGKIVLRLSD